MNAVRSLIYLAIALLMAVPAQAENRRLVHQGRVLRPDGKPLEGIFHMEARIYSPAPSSCLLWAEGKNVSFGRGSFSMEIGESTYRYTGTSGGRSTNFPSVFINNAAYNLTGADCESGSTYNPASTDGRRMVITLSDGPQTIRVYEGPIRSVPYAIEASNSSMVGGYDSQHIFKFNEMGSHKPSLTFSTLGASVLWELAENSSFSGRRLTGLANPTDPTDAVNLQSMNSAIAAAVTGGSVAVVSHVAAEAGANASSVLDITGGPVTSTGTFSFSFLNQSAGLIFAAPTGSAGAPSFRALAASDIPGLDASKITSGTLGVSRGGTGLSSYTPNALLASNMTGDALVQWTCANGEVLVWQTGTGWACEAKTSGSGTMSYLDFTASSIFSVTGGPVTSTGTINLSMASQAQGLVLASPTGASGTPSFRALAGTDLPILAGTGVTVTLTGGSLEISAAGSGGSVTSVTAGTGLLGGSITSAGTLAVDVGLTDGKIVQVGTGDKIPVALIPNLDASIITTGTLATSRGGTGLDASAATDGQILIGNGSGFTLNTLTAGTGISIVNSAGSISISSTLGGGTVTNVGLEAPTSVFTVANSPVTGAGTMVIDFASQGAAQVFASPTGAAGVPTFRALSASDIPGLDASKIVSGTLGVGVGGTGLVPSAGDANKVYGLDATGLASEFKDIIAGTGVSITHGAGSMVISAAGSGGTVTNIGALVPSFMTVSPAAITSSGTFDFSFNSQAAALVFASPTGAAGAPSFRALAGSDLPILAGTGVNVTLTGGSLEISSSLAGGTVTNVGLEAPTSVFTVANSPVTGAGTMVIDFASQGAAQVFASPTGAAGVPTFRALSALDIPGLDASKIVSGTLGVGVGGTGLVPTAGDANKVYGLDATGLASEFKDIIAGTGVSITHGAGSMVISAAGSGGTVTSVTAGTGLLGGVISSAGTLAVDVGLTDGKIVQVGTGDKIPVALIPNLDASIITSGTLATSRGGTGVDGSAATDGQILIGNGTGFSLNTLTAGTGISIVNTAGSISISSTLGGGTVTNVGLTAPTSVFSVTGSPVTGAGTMVVDFAQQGAATVFAAPTGATGVPTFRALSASDIPGLDASKITSGTLGVGVGGTGLVPTAGDANKVYGLDATGLASEFKDIVAGTGVSITHGAGSMVISAAGSGGTVTNIGAIVPSYMTVSPAAITSSGTFDFSFNSQAAALVFASPTGASGAPVFRALAASDIPPLDASKITSGTLPVSLGGTGLSSYTPYALFASNMTGDAIEQRTCSAGEILVWQVATGWTCEAKGSGSVSNVGLTAPTSVFTVTGSPVTGAGTMVVDFSQQGAATVFAAPTGATGVPTFRALASEDIPGLDASKITSGTLGVNRGGTGLVPAAGDANQIYGVNAAGSAAEFKTLVAGTGLSISHSAGTISLSMGSTGVGQWQDNANGIHYSSGSVGIGTATPTTALHVNGELTANGWAMPVQGNGISVAGTGMLVFWNSWIGFENDLASTGGAATPNIRAAAGSNTSPTYSFNGDSNTGMYSAVFDTLSFSTNSTERLHINSGGNVGVGTGSPTVALDVVATGTLGSAIRFPRATTAMRPVGSAPGDLQGMMRYNTDLGKYEVYEGTTGWASISTGSVASSQWTSIANGIHYSLGSVGIGTASPQSTLDLQTDSGLTVKNPNLGQDGGGIINLSGRFNGTATSFTRFAAITGAKENGTSGNDAGYFAVYTAPNAGALSERLRISSTGDVGIGTSTPTSRLSVNGNVDVSGSIVASSTTGPGGEFTSLANNSSNASLILSRGRADGAQPGANIGPGIDFYNETSTQGNYNYTGFIHNAWETTQSDSSNRSSDMRFGVARMGTEFEAMRISSRGMLGLGTTSPTAMLDIASNGTVGSAIRIPQDSTANRPSAPGLGMIRYNTTDNKYEVYETTGWASLSTGSVASSQWTTVANGIHYSGGSVGIGTSSPSSILGISGQAARTIAMERNTTANTAGNALSIQAGGATVGATNRAGGDLNLYSGQSTGSGQSKINFYVYDDDGGTATSENVAHNALTIHPSGGMVNTYYDYNSGVWFNGFTMVNDIDHSAGAALTLAKSRNWGAIYAGDTLGQIDFWGDTTAAGKLKGGQIRTVMNNVSAGTQAATMSFATMTGGTLADRMTILGHGNVGIGTETPTVALDVVATGTLGSAIRFPRASSAMRPVGSAPGDLQGMMRYNTDLGKYEVYEGTTGWASLSTGTAGASQWTSVANGIHYSSGSVGIGTSSPRAPLHVNGFQTMYDGSDIAAFMFNSYYSSGDKYLTADSAFEIWHSRGSDALIFGAAAPGAANAALSYTNALAIKDNGNVGIGTTNPIAALTVQGTGVLVLQGADPSAPVAAPALQARTASGFSALPAYSFWYQDDTGISNPALATIGLVTSNSERMRVAANGRIGIGTTTPTVALDVVSTGTLGSAIRFPRATTAMRPVGSAPGDLQGMMRYNTDLSKYEVYEGTTGWASLSTSSASLSFPLLANPIGTAGAPAYSFSGDSDTGLYSPGAGTVAISTNGTQRLTVDSTGRTTFAGGLLLNQGSAATDNLFYVGSNTAGSVNASAGFFVGGLGSQDATEGPHFLMRGNSFSQFGNQRGSMMFFAGAPSSPGGNEGQIGFYVNNETNPRFKIRNGGSVEAGDTGQTSGMYTFEVGANGNHAVMTDAAAGAIVYPLAVNNRAAAATGNGSGITFRATSSTSSFRTLANISAITTNSTDATFAGDLLFETSTSSTTVTEKMRILSGGNVGIGTPSPAAKLDVSGDIKVGNSSATCDSTTEGSMRYNSTIKGMQFCDGTTWISMDSNLGLKGKLRYPAAANCEWKPNVTTYTSITTPDADCGTATVTGAAQLPTEGKIPAIRMSSLGAGTYRVSIYTFLYTSSSSTTCMYRLSDGTNHANGVYNYGIVADSKLEGIFTYATAQTNITFYLQTDRDSGTGTCDVYGDGDPGELTFTVEKISN